MNFSDFERKVLLNEESYYTCVNPGTSHTKIQQDNDVFDSTNKR